MSDMNPSKSDPPARKTEKLWNRTPVIPQSCEIGPRRFHTTVKCVKSDPGGPISHISHISLPISHVSQLCEMTGVRFHSFSVFLAGGSDFDGFISLIYHSSFSDSTARFLISQLTGRHVMGRWHGKYDDMWWAHYQNTQKSSGFTVFFLKWRLWVSALFGNALYMFSSF